jgi:glutamine cyclotransferase
MRTKSIITGLFCLPAMACFAQRDTTKKQSIDITSSYKPVLRNAVKINFSATNLYFVNPDNFKIRTTTQVTDNIGPVNNLNELELINGFVFANVYQSDFIVKIDPANGHVVGKIDLSGLKDQYFKNLLVPERTDVLNGIAYDSTTKKIYITGKRWPKMFEAFIN